MALAALVFMRFGGFGTGENVNPEEFLAYAEPVENITVPESAKIIALGEATHGNAEFQQLKLEVFKQMVKNNGVRAFALEGDYGGCEQVNRYIHGGEGTAQEAAAAIGFSIYRTEEMAELISYMRQYNESALEGEDLRFYGFDMQRISYSMRFLKESCKELEVDTTNLQKLVEGENWSSECDLSTRIETLTQVKKELESKNGSGNAIHFVDILMQHSELQTLTNADGATLRDQFMAENVQWILQQEQRNGHEKIFVTGHNSHVAKWGSSDSMGKLLSKDAANGYYVIGTDFYKTHCNMPTRSPEKRTIQVFYSHDPLAKAAKLAGFDICWLDFTKVPENSELGRQTSEYTYMGTLGESYSIIMRLLPPSVSTSCGALWEKVGTRLIDFTKSVDVALYFACCEEDNDGAVFVQSIVPHEEEWYTVHILLEIANLESEKVNVRELTDILWSKYSLFSERFEDKGMVDNAITALIDFGIMIIPEKETLIQNKRMCAQEGCLWICGNRLDDRNQIRTSLTSKSMYFYPNDYCVPEWFCDHRDLLKIVIPKRKKEEFLCKLSDKNISRESLFPD